MKRTLILALSGVLATATMALAAQSANGATTDPAAALTLDVQPVGGSYVTATGTSAVANDVILIQRQQGSTWVAAAYLRATGTTYTMTGVQSDQVATYRAVEGTRVTDPVTVDLADAPAPTLTVRPVGGNVVQATGTSVVPNDTIVIQRQQGPNWVTAAVVQATGTTYTETGLQVDQVATYRAAEGTYRSEPVTVDLADAPVPTAPAPSQPPATDEPPADDSTAPADAAPCGGPVLRADGTTWDCTFDDEFDGTSLDRSKWVAQADFATGWPTFACYRDDPANISVGGGQLHLTVRKENTAAPCKARGGATTAYTGGMVATYHLFSQQYGRFEARMRQPSFGTPGLHDAFWLWPDDRYSTINWPDSGEIDVAELYSWYPVASIPFLHYSLDRQGILYGTNTSTTCTIRPGDFNTYTMEWSPTKIEIFVNGKSCLVNTSGDPAFKKRYAIALTAGLGDGANALTPATPIPATLDVDYVRVWS
jgi:hypothetical protein